MTAHGMFMRKYKSKEAACKSRTAYCKYSGWDESRLKIVFNGEYWQIDVRSRLREGSC